MAGSCATLNVAPCYIICSVTQAAGYGNPDAETASRPPNIPKETPENPKATQRARLTVGPADHGAARPAGATLEFADTMGASRTTADLARPARGVRRGLPHRAAGTAFGAAAGGPCRTRPGRRISA